jgi:hypothetical protein
VARLILLLALLLVLVLPACARLRAVWIAAQRHSSRG